MKPSMGKWKPAMNKSLRDLIGPDYELPHQKDIVFPANDFLTFLLSEFKRKLLTNNISCYYERVAVSCTNDQLREFFSKFNPVFIYNVVREKDFYSFENDDVIFTCGVDDAMMIINGYGEQSKVREFIDSLTEKFETPGSYVRWIYDPQYMESMMVALPNKNEPFTEMYPFLGEESLAEYYDRFMESDASILLLLGPPGTGKTSFLRGLLHHTGQNAILTYHSKLLEQDSFFAEWFKSPDENIVIMEDSDTLLLPRSDGNSMMQRFLNLGDGLLTIRGKKMIFTTNLPNTNAIDEALTRPGRCHDILEFRPLNRQQAQTVADKSGVTLNSDKSEMTIAEIFSDMKTRKSVKQTTQKFGFI